MRERQNAILAFCLCNGRHRYGEEGLCATKNKKRRAKRCRANSLFRRTKPNFRRAITCRHLFFARRKKLFVAQNSVAHVQYSVAQTTHLVAQKKLIRRARVHRYYTLRDDGISVAQKPTCILAPKKSFPRVLTRRFIVSSR